MKRVSLRRERPKHHRVRNAAIVAGAAGAATAGVRRWRHRNDQPSE
jgi:hypothetical protein